MWVVLFAAVFAATPQAPTVPLRFEAAQGGWSVYEGFETRLDCAAFAALVGDVTTLERLARERHRSQGRALAQGLVAGALVLAGARAAVAPIPSPDVAPGALEPRQSLGDAVERARYLAEQDRAYTAAFLVGSGLTLAFTLPAIRAGTRARQAEPRNYYDRALAAALVEAYNARGAR